MGSLETEVGLIAAGKSLGKLLADVPVGWIFQVEPRLLDKIEAEPPSEEVLLLTSRFCQLLNIRNVARMP